MPKTYWIYLFAALFCVNTIAAPQLTIVTESLPPVQYVANGELVGSATKIVRAVLKKSGLDADIQIMPWARAYSIAKEKPNTLIYSIHRTPFREAQFHWIGPVADFNVALLELLPGPGNRINKIEDAKGFIVGVIRHSSPHEYLLRKGFTEEQNLFLFGSRAEEMRLFVNRKIDFILGSDIGMDMKLGEMGYEKLRVHIAYTDPQLSENLYLAASLNTDKKLLKKLNQSMQKVMQTNEYQLWYNSTSSLSISPTK